RIELEDIIFPIDQFLPDPARLVAFEFVFGVKGNYTHSMFFKPACIFRVGKSHHSHIQAGFSESYDDLSLRSGRVNDMIAADDKHFDLAIHGKQDKFTCKTTKTHREPPNQSTWHIRKRICLTTPMILIRI